MITNVLATFAIPREGAMVLLQDVRQAWCQGCPAGTGAGTPPASQPDRSLSLALVTNNPPLSAALVFADLVLSDDTGGVPVELNDQTPVVTEYCTDSIEGPDIGVDGEWRLVIDQRIFTSAGDGTTPATVYAVALVDTDEELLIGYYAIEGGPAAFAEEDIIKVTGDLVLLPQIPVDLTPP